MLGVAWLSLLGGVAFGQGITPPVFESRGGTKVEGMFEISNPADYAMATMLEAKSFSVDDSGPTLRPLDASIQVKLGSNSFILKAHDKRMIFYKASFTTAPVSFAIVTSMSKAGALDGMRINYIFPHIIYAYQKDKLTRSDVNIGVEGGFLRIHNLSQKMGRITTIQVAKSELQGFPLYPGQTRLVPVTNNKLSVKFEDGFTIEVQ